MRLASMPVMGVRDRAAAALARFSWPPFGSAALLVTTGWRIFRHRHDHDSEEALVDKGFSPTYGARFLKRTIDELVKLPVTQLWNEGDHFTVSLVGGEVVVEMAS